MKINLLFLGALLLLAGCEKYAGPTTATGVVVDAHTGQPVGGATVQALRSSSGASGGGTAPGRSTQADGQGRFRLSFEADAKQDYQLLAYAAPGYSNQGDGPFVTGGAANDGLLVPVDAPAWVRISCVDDPPYGKVGLTTWGYSGSADNQNVGPGNFSFIRPNRAYAQDNLILWRMIDEQAHITTGQIPFTVAGLDTATVTIHF